MKFTRQPSEPLSPRARWLLAGLATVLSALLATAAALEPTAAGIGTHRQLGLSECFVLRQWGIRCPTCGTTTAWARLLDLDLPGAIDANVGGTLLAVAALLAVPWSLATAAHGRWCYLRPTANLVLPAVAVLGLVILVDWLRHTGLALIGQSWS